MVVGYGIISAMSTAGQHSRKRGPKGVNRFARWGGQSPREARALVSVSASVARRLSAAYRREDRRFVVDAAISAFLDSPPLPSPVISENRFRRFDYWGRMSPIMSTSVWGTKIRPGRAFTPPGRVCGRDRPFIFNVD